MLRVCKAASMPIDAGIECSLLFSKFNTCKVCSAPMFTSDNVLTWLLCRSRTYIHNVHIHSLHFLLNVIMHVSLRDLHWLQSWEHIDFKLAVLVYRRLHGLAPRYLSDHFKRVVSYNRRRLPSSSSSSLLIRQTRLITVGDRAFPVAGRSRLWNSLPHVITSAPTLAVFRNQLKTYLFSRSFTHWLMLIQHLVV